MGADALPEKGGDTNTAAGGLGGELSGVGSGPPDGGRCSWGARYLGWHGKQYKTNCCKMQEGVLEFWAGDQAGAKMKIVPDGHRYAGDCIRTINTIAFIRWRAWVVGHDEESSYGPTEQAAIAELLEKLEEAENGTNRSLPG